MHEKAHKELALFLGDVMRDFGKEPLTQQEINSAILVYSKELTDKELHPDLKTLYEECLVVLKKHLLLH